VVEVVEVVEVLEVLEVVEVVEVLEEVEEVEEVVVGGGGSPPRWSRDAVTMANPSAERPWVMSGTTSNKRYGEPPATSRSR
jgi:hypothetical protein